MDGNEEDWKESVGTGVDTASRAARADSEALLGVMVNGDNR